MSLCLASDIVPESPFFAALARRPDAMPDGA
jgi:hypothetical protein